MNQFNFKSAICTSREQSKRLLALGLKKETADMYYRFYDADTYEVNPTWETIWEDRNDYKKIIPAWSLHRLLSLLPKEIPCEEENGLGMYLGKRNAISYFGVLGYYTHENLYDVVILCIEDVIKEGYFNKEYLV